MKLSEIKGDSVIDVVADLIEPIANIAQDEEATRFLKREKLPEGEDARTFTIKRLKSSLPILLKEHKEDVISILATLNMQGEKEYRKNLTMATLLRDFSDAVSDPAFIGLFR